MRKWESAFITAAAFYVLAASPAFANPGQGLALGHGKHDKAAPGPLAGAAAGLPLLILVGGYALVRRRRNRTKAE